MNNNKCKYCQHSLYGTDGAGMPAMWCSRDFVVVKPDQTCCDFEREPGSDDE